MRRRSVLFTLLLLAAVGGYFAYRSQHELRQAWGQIHHELGGGQVPDPAGVLDDPVFQALPPPEKPVSLGRYTPATPREATPPEQVPPAPEPKPQPPLEPEPVKEAAPQSVQSEPAQPEPPRSEATQPKAAQPAPRTPAVPASQEVQRQEIQAVAPVPAKPPQPPAAPTPRPERATPEPAPPVPAPPVPAAAVPPVPVQAPKPSPAPVRNAEPVQSPPAPAATASQKPAPVQMPAPSQTSPPVQTTGAPRRSAVTTSARFIDRVNSSHRLHILVMGNDQDALGRGRADVLMVLTFDPVAQRLTFLNIPRDTRVSLPGRGWVKINAGYAYGGPELQTTMVERFLGIPMDKYVEISQGGFKAAIDAVGGVEVSPRFAFTVNDRYEFPLGPQRLDGEMALIYSTMRKQDPEGDFGRNRRQQEVLRSLLAEMGQLEPLDLAPRISGLLAELASTLRTDLTPAEVLALRRAHPYLTSEQVTERVQGKGGTIGGTWFYSVPDRERQRLHLLLRDQ